MVFVKRAQRVFCAVRTELLNIPVSQSFSGSAVCACRDRSWNLAVTDVEIWTCGENRVTSSGMWLCVVSRGSNGSSKGRWSSRSWPISQKCAFVGLQGLNKNKQNLGTDTQGWLLYSRAPRFTETAWQVKATRNTVLGWILGQWSTANNTWRGASHFEFSNFVIVIKWTKLWWTDSIHGRYEGWNFNSGNYLFTTDTK